MLRKQKMITFFDRLLAVDSDDVEIVRRGRMLNIILIVVVIIVLYRLFNNIPSYFRATSPQEISKRLIYIGQDSFVILLVLFMLWMSRRGLVKLASSIFILFVSVVPFFFLFQHAFYSQIAPIYCALVIVLSSLFIAPATSFFFATLATVVIIVVNISRGVDYFVTYVIVTIFYILAIALWLLARSWGQTIKETQTQSKELEKVNEELTDTIEEIQRREEELEQVNEAQERLLELVRELSIPAIPLWEGILLMPLTGVLDTRRMQQITEGLLKKVSNRRAKIVIIDVTGVPTIDTSTVKLFLTMVQALKLIGAEVLLVGINAEVAQTMIGLGIELGEVKVLRDLQDGIEHALGVMNRRGGINRER